MIRGLLIEFLLALQFLTIVRLTPLVRPDSVTLGRAGAFFPFIGLLLGAIAWAVDELLHTLVPPPFVNGLLILLLLGLSYGIFIDGLANSADGLCSPGGREQRIARMHARTIGGWGVLAILIVIFLKLQAFEVLHGGYRSAALLLAPMLGRWACVVMAYSSRPARDEGIGALLVQGVAFREFGLSSVFTLIVVFTLVEVGGLLIFLGLAIAIIGWILYCNRRLDGITGDLISALGEIVETATFCLFAAFELLVKSA